MVTESRRIHNVTADATVEVQRYLAERNIGRTEYFSTGRGRGAYIQAYTGLLWDTCAPLPPQYHVKRFSPKPERLFPKRETDLSPSTVEKILFLNKNE